MKFSDNHDHNFYKRMTLSALIVALIGIGIAISYYNIELLLLVFLALLMAIPIHWFTEMLSKNLKLPRWLALLLVVLVFLSGVAGVLMFLVPTIIEQTLQLRDTLLLIPDKLAQYRVGKQWLAIIERNIKVENIAANLQTIDWNSVFQRTAGIFSSVLTLVTFPLIAIIFAIYMSSEPKTYIHGVLSISSEKYHSLIEETLKEIAHTLRWWILGQSISMLMIGTATSVSLWLLHVPHAFLLGIFTALMTFIPNLGPTVAAIPVVLSAFTLSPLTAVIAGLIYVGLQFIETVLLTPIIQRKVVALPPLLIIVTQVILAKFAGILGIIIAAPFIACVIVIVKTFRSTRNDY